jgi:hypothetical protein
MRKFKGLRASQQALHHSYHLCLHNELMLIRCRATAYIRDHCHMAQRRR